MDNFRTVAQIREEMEALTNETRMNHVLMVGRLNKPGYNILETLTPLKVHAIHAVLGIAGEVGELMLAIYNKDFPNVEEELGDLEFYLEALRAGFKLSRVLDIPTHQYIPNAQMTAPELLVMQSADLVDIIKKWVIYDKKLEMGSVIQQLACIDASLDALRRAYSLTFQQVLQHNLHKLSEGENARYRDGYSDKAAQERQDKQEEFPRTKAGHPLPDKADEPEPTVHPDDLHHLINR